MAGLPAQTLEPNGIHDGGAQSEMTDRIPKFDFDELLGEEYHYFYEQSLTTEHSRSSRRRTIASQTLPSLRLSMVSHLDAQNRTCNSYRRGNCPGGNAYSRKPSCYSSSGLKQAV